MKISVIVVTLNSGNDLIKTVDSVLLQKKAEYEIIIKDGGSTDGSIEQLPKDERIAIYNTKDSGIYSAMNQAIQYVTGEYCLFMNTGDIFFDENVLSKIECYLKKADYTQNLIYYGDCFTENRNSTLKYPDRFDDYVCFTMILCHQATIYPTWMLKERQFSLDYKVAADYEYYVHAYTHGTQLKHLPITIVRYKGDGASEKPQNRKKALKESQAIRKKCFTKKRYWKTWLKTQLHGVGFKHMLVQQEWFYPVYKKIARKYYDWKNRKG